MTPSSNPNPYAAPMMAADATPPSSGLAHPLLFPLAAMGCLAVSLALAACLTGLFHSGFYLIVLVPIVAGAAIAVSVYWAIRLGQCRNRWLGMALGLVCACVVYFGYYYIDMIVSAGMWRPDLLPSYIAHRIENYVTVPTGNPDPNVNAKPFWPINALFFVAELGLMVWVSGVVGFRAASRAFDEAQGRWAEAAHTTIAYGQSHILKDAKQRGNLLEGLSAVQPVRNQLQQPHCMLVLESFNGPDGRPVRTFLSAYELRMPGQVLSINELLFTKRVAMRQVELSAQELEAAMRLFRVEGTTK
jgi:hypothetical protein